jgi:serine/threonine-protein kinase RsbT
MDTSDAVHVRIEHEVDVVAARQFGKEVARLLGFGNTDLTLIATAISEVARNIILYAGSGEIVISRSERDSREGITIVASDNGPGIADIDRAMQDGYSSGSGLGLGLPGARRLMDDFSIESTPGVGTTVSMSKWRTSR